MNRKNKTIWEIEREYNGRYTKKELLCRIMENYLAASCPKKERKENGKTKKS